jgi:protein MpaA
VIRLISILACLGIVGGAAAAQTAARADEIESDVAELCTSLDKAFHKRNWGRNPCGKINWVVDSTSVQGRPLIYADFGPATATNTTLIFSMVHGDEITPLYMGFELAKWAEANMKNYPNTRLVLAPLLNPDGFFGYPKTRTNAHGVDCNRNFDTKDWKREALKSWKTKYRSDKRRFPGYKPDSEPETLFQKKLIDQVKPAKIISIHSPLNVMDYDGPDHLKLSRFPAEYIKKCEELRTKVRAKSTGFYPGSLGNYSGIELGIPTITLELPTANYVFARKYWEAFQKGLETVIKHEIPQKKN